MNILKVLLIVLATIIAVITALAVVGTVLNWISTLFWLAVICVVLLALVKLFGSKSDSAASADDNPDRLQGVEQTLDDYRRKLEAEVKQSREKKY
ncbi:MAG TPA: hypothetical protein PLD20_27850 [Blastocatellia bacterium]|nr:hypothetical protein [Blastocatellia bacterium]HMV82463.1 hypothetical protein [Blastocatellia bacterium]HMX26982.1 hypothetical protein [Blastocatellia bacterium]HMY73617.1 hypothetical protein [Blastocatellia bacterium]HMZ21777.1 hypothetical protein [Blastocatellia bacterium]